MPTTALLALTASLSAASALRLPTQLDAPQTRRGAVHAAAIGALGSVLATVAPAVAAPSELAKQLASGAISQEEFYAAAAARKEADRVAALPINQLKAAREKLASNAPGLIEKGDWSTLRDIISETTGTSFTKNKEEANLKGETARNFSIIVRKKMFEIDSVAYSNQSFLPGAFTGYCADGVVPRDDSGCKVKPKVDTKPLIVALNEAIAAFDGLIALY